jgi:hypothetical protein
LRKKYRTNNICIMKDTGNKQWMAIWLNY